MRALSRGLSKFCYNHPNFGIAGLMKYIAIGNVAVYLVDFLTNNMASLLLGFYPALVMQGQVWRLVTFVFVPEYSGFVLFFILSTFFYYWIGTTLERQWGTARFTIYYGTGVLMNIAVGLVLSGINPMIETISISMYYINMSLFFAFATLFPDMQVYLYGILPLKVKWLAWFDVALFGWSIVSSLMHGSILGAVLPIVAILNFILFFWEQLTGTNDHTSWTVRQKRTKQAVNFKRAQQDIRQRKGYLHKCEVCGVTDESDPNMEFRYCSKCEGYHCFCINHIHNHDHIQ